MLFQISLAVAVGDGHRIFQTDRMEAVDYSFHQKVYEGYRALIEKDPDKFIVIDASGTIEQTQQALRKVLFDKGILQ